MSRLRIDAPRLREVAFEQLVHRSAQPAINARDVRLAIVQEATRVEVRTPPPMGKPDEPSKSGPRHDSPALLPLLQ